jgi:hypothetical protein
MKSMRIRNPDNSTAKLYISPLFCIFVGHFFRSCSLPNSLRIRFRNSVLYFAADFRNDLLPLIPSGESHFTSRLSVRVTDGPNLVTTNFTFFDCNSYSSCTSCVSSPFPCDWCVDGTNGHYYITVVLSFWLDPQCC